MKVRHLAALSDPKDVLPHFEKHGFLDRFRSKATQTNDKLPRLERIWFPYYLLNFTLQYPGQIGNSQVIVEAWSGSFNLFDDSDGGIHDGPPEDDCDTFPPRLTLDEAEEKGREELVRAILRQRRRRVRPAPGPLDRAELLYWPLWVWYYERRPGYIDIKVRDAHASKPIGGRTRRGVMDAFAAKARREEAVPGDGGL